MNSQELIQLMQTVEQKGIGWDKVEAKLKIKKDLLDLYAKSGPVPVTIIKGLKTLIETEGK
jgi:hypothetical protein